MAKSRLIRELGTRSQEFQLQLIDDDLTRWTGVLQGPKDTPFEGGSFRLEFRIPENYPYLAPKVIFRTRIFHPNVHFESGEICLDILKSDWSPAWSIESICRAILVLLATPNSDSPLNCDAGNMLRAGDVRAYNCMARMYTVDYAGKTQT